jgi:hypothetical protein
MLRPFVNDVYNLINSSLHTGGSGERFKTIGRKNAIKHEKGTPTLVFLTTPITPSKEFDQNPTSVFQLLWFSDYTDVHLLDY